MYLNTYFMGLRSIKIFKFFQCGDRLYSQNLTSTDSDFDYKDGLRAETVNKALLVHFEPTEVICSNF